MLRRVRIVKKATGQQVAEFPLLLDEKASEQSFFDKAWFRAIDEGSVIEANKINYEIAFTD